MRDARADRRLVRRRCVGRDLHAEPGREKVFVYKEDIIRVEYTNANALPTKTSLSVSNTWSTPTPFCVSESAGSVTITTSRIKVTVNEMTGVVTYTDLSGAALVSEASKSLTAATVEGVATNTVQATFNSPANEALFGLGQHQDGVINRKGTTLRMLNANTEIQIPVLVSNKGYGVFWDNYSTTNFAGNANGNTRYSFSSEAGDLVDYYFFYGPTIDQVIANYRTTTGAAPLFPKWGYGLFQSKDHYQSSAELTAVQQGYRNNNIPVDVIVQDWQYWTPWVWGSHFMDTTPLSGSGGARDAAARREHPHDDLDLAALSDPGQWRGHVCGRARQLQRAQRDQRALSNDDGRWCVPLLRHVQRRGPDAGLSAVVRSAHRKLRLGRDLGRQHGAPELSRGRERARGHYRARKGRLLHQCLSAGAQPRAL